MSDIPGELARVQGAFQQPTLTLLHQKLAPVIIAIFRNSVTLDVRTIDAARLHQQVDTYLAELRLAGHTDLPTGRGRDLCLRWMRGQWPVRSAEADATEVYALTSHAQGRPQPRQGADPGASEPQQAPHRHDHRRGSPV